MPRLHRLAVLQMADSLLKDAEDLSKSMSSHKYRFESILATITHVPPSAPESQRITNGVLKDVIPPVLSKIDNWNKDCTEWLTEIRALIALLKTPIVLPAVGHDAARDEACGPSAGRPTRKRAQASRRAAPPTKSTRSAPVAGKRAGNRAGKQAGKQAGKRAGKRRAAVNHEEDSSGEPTDEEEAEEPEQEQDKEEESENNAGEEPDNNAEEDEQNNADEVEAADHEEDTEGSAGPKTARSRTSSKKVNRTVPVRAAAAVTAPSRAIKRTRQDLKDSGADDEAGTAGESADGDNPGAGGPSEEESVPSQKRAKGEAGAPVPRLTRSAASAPKGSTTTSPPSPPQKRGRKAGTSRLVNLHLASSLTHTSSRGSEESSRICSKAVRRPSTP